MQLNFEAIVLSIKKYGENSGIACVLTQDYGIYKGLVRGVSSAKQRGVYQSGNIIEAKWQARLAEHLGNLSAGLLHCGAMAVMDNPFKLAALSSVCSVLEVALQEHDPAPEIYKKFKLFLFQLISENENWQQAYVMLELELLCQLGFGLNLDSCVVTGEVDNLVYVSPKSGRAVCREAGLPYHDKMLNLPEFILQNPQNGDVQSLHIAQGLDLCGYFMDKYFFAPHNIKQPQARFRFAAMMKKVAIGCTT